MGWGAEGRRIGEWGRGVGRWGEVCSGEGGERGIGRDGVPERGEHANVRIWEAGKRVRGCERLKGC